MDKFTVIFLVLFLCCPPVAFSATHDITGLELDDSGWTDLSKLVQINSRIVYVSTSGNDGSALNYDHASFANPFLPLDEMAYATVATAFGQLREGYPDIILLKRGDDFTAQPSLRIDISGESPGKRLIISAYGPESIIRPKFSTLRIDDPLAGNIIIHSLSLGSTYRGIGIEAAVGNVLIENCYIAPFVYSGIVVQNISGHGGINNLAIRRCVIAGRYRPSGSSTYVQGVFVDDAISFLFEENVIDDNGRDEFDVPNDTPDGRSSNTYFMLGRSADVEHIIRYNQSSRASAIGIQAGSGGEIYGNLSVQDPIAYQVVREDEWWDSGMVANVNQNVALHMIDINPTSKRGWGIRVANAVDSTISDNILAGNTESNYPFSIRIEANMRGDYQMYVRNLTVRGNLLYNNDGDVGGIDYIDGTDVCLIPSDQAYDPTKTYRYGSDPEDFLTGIKLINNEIHNEGLDKRISTRTFASSIIESSGNKYYSTRAADKWFRVDGVTMDIATFNALVDDASSVEGQTTPAAGYGIIDYLTSIGATATLDNYYSKIRAQRKGNWDTRYTAVSIINFVRDKFSKQDITYSISSSPSASSGLTPPGTGRFQVGTGGLTIQ